MVVYYHNWLLVTLVPSLLTLRRFWMPPLTKNSWEFYYYYLGDVFYDIFSLIVAGLFCFYGRQKSLRRFGSFFFVRMFLSIFVKVFKHKGSWSQGRLAWALSLTLASVEFKNWGVDSTIIQRLSGGARVEYSNIKSRKLPTVYEPTDIFLLLHTALWHFHLD